MKRGAALILIMFFCLSFTAYAYEGIKGDCPEGGELDCFSSNQCRETVSCTLGHYCEKYVFGEATMCQYPGYPGAIGDPAFNGLFCSAAKGTWTAFDTISGCVFGDDSYSGICDEGC
ncbi:MAG: hypothetical protein U9Q69_02985, partial [Nanoarchaeota archaeon]|nr:hypothetical protein [Nanoarchaeota archaeon]